MSLTDDRVYRVRYIDTNNVTVLPIGIDCLDSVLRGDYLVSELPEWMRDKLSVLALLHTPPPLTEVEGVGQRMSPDIFWVYD